MSGVDRMGVTDRSYVCATCGALLAGDEAALDHASDEGHNVLPRSAVPGLVPAERLRGAVKERDELRAILEAARDMIGNTAHHPDLKARVRAALGGQ